MRSAPSDADCKAFDAWHSQPGNAEAYARAKEEWAFTGQMSPDRIMADRRYFQREAKTRFLRWALPATAAVLFMFGAGWYMQRSAYQPQVAQRQSPAGAQSEILSDGSRVTLADGARLESRFSSGRRLLILTGGRARFEVTHDSARPFTVLAGRSQTTALGTIFEVDTAGGNPRVTLIRGAVEVRSSAGGAPLRLAPGERAEVPATGPRRLPAMAGRIAVPTTLLVADHLPLGAVLDRARKTDAKPIRLADPALASLEVSGRFDVSAGMALARKLAAALDLEAEESASEIILRKKIIV